MSRERQAISDKFPSRTSCDSRFWLQRFLSWIYWDVSLICN